MDDREDLIRALGDAFKAGNGEEKQDEALGYRFERVTVDDVESSRLLNITEPARTIRKMSDEMLPIVDLSAFLKKNGSLRARGVELLLRQCLESSMEDDDRFKRLSELASDLLTRFRSAGDSEVKQTLVIAHCENCLKTFE